MDPPPLPPLHTISAQSKTNLKSVYITPSTSPPTSRAPTAQPSRRPSAPPSKRPRHSSRSSSVHGRAGSSSSSLTQENAFDLHSARVESAQRVRNVWSQLAEKYVKPLDQDDILDLRNNKVIADHGVLRAADEQYDFGYFGDAPEEENQTPDGETEGEDCDELDLLATEADISDELTANAHDIPPVRAMDPSDMADLNEFLEMERHRRDEFGDIDAEQEVENVTDLRKWDGGSSEGLSEAWVDEPDDALGPATSSDGGQVAEEESDRSDDELNAWEPSEASMLYQLTDGDDTSADEQGGFEPNGQILSVGTPPNPSSSPRKQPSSLPVLQSAVKPRDQSSLPPSSPPLPERELSSSPEPEIVPARKSRPPLDLSPAPTRSSLPVKAQNLSAKAESRVSQRVLQLQTPPRSRSSAMTPDKDAGHVAYRLSGKQRKATTLSSSVPRKTRSAHVTSENQPRSPKTARKGSRMPWVEIDDEGDGSNIQSDSQVPHYSRKSKGKARMREPQSPDLDVTLGSNDESTPPKQSSPPRRTERIALPHSDEEQRRQSPSMSSPRKRKRPSTSSESGVEYFQSDPVGQADTSWSTHTTQSRRKPHKRDNSPILEIEERASHHSRGASRHRSRSHAYSMPPERRRSVSPVYTYEQRVAQSGHDADPGRLDLPPLAQDPQASYMFAQAWQYIVRGMSVLGGGDVILPGNHQQFAPPIPPFTPNHQRFWPPGKTNGYSSGYGSSSSASFSTPRHRPHPYPEAYTPSFSRGTLPPSSPPPSSSPLSAFRGARSRSRGRSKSLARRVSFSLGEEAEETDAEVAYSSSPTRELPRIRQYDAGSSRPPFAYSSSRRSQSTTHSAGAYVQSSPPRSRGTPAPQPLARHSGSRARRTIHISDEEAEISFSEEEVVASSSSRYPPPRINGRGQTPGPPEKERTPEPIRRPMARRGRSSRR